MEIVGLFLLIQLLGFLTLSAVNVISERRHEQDLDRREAAIGHFPIFATNKVPVGFNAHQSQLVTGNVVLGSGHLKQFLASFRTLVGGEMRGYQRVLDRGRREAQLRMVEEAQRLGEEAQRLGATTVINVRFESANVGNGNQAISEIFCYGTMIQ